MKTQATAVALVLSCALSACASSETVSATSSETVSATTSASSDWSEHFHPKGNPPSEHTLAIIREARETLPFHDTRDFDEERKGFIAAPESWTIAADAGHTAWDMERYKFFLEEKDWDSIHPSLQRQGQLNMNFGLYEVIPDVYQVRGFDLANITFVRGDTGWIVFDPLTALETARAALELINEHVEELPVVAVVYSHSHADHFGGVRGIVDEADVRSGKVKIIVPRAFMDNAISENVFAGNAMTRRLFYQYGVLLPAGPFGHAGQGLSQNVAAGNMGLIPPNVLVDGDLEEMTIDGVRMIFQNTPRTEAPSEMNTYFPDWKALWMAENVTGTVHNIYTLRGAPVRDAHRWAKYINEALYLFGQEAEVMFASHHWPRWGNERVQEVLRDQRDIYAHQNNYVLHLANQGVTINQVHNEYAVPASLQEGWTARFYHGSPEHNSRGVLNRFLGYWDANPATLIPLSPADSAPLYAEMMGGAQKIMAKGRELYAAGKYRYAQEILNKLVQAEPDNRAAKDLLADIFEQIGYQQENPGLRNSFLAGAFELRSGIPEGASPDSLGPDMIRAMTTEMFLDFLGIRMNAPRTAGWEFTINLSTPDNGEMFVIEMSNETLTNIAGYKVDDADLDITIDRADLEMVMRGEKTFQQQIEDGTATVDGDVGILARLGEVMVTFEMGFEIMPGTKGPASDEELNPYEVRLGDISGE
jgi:alkyl sulfatase BDS1-like metallo-beta-lactamase superfamily hydrolase